MEYYLDAFKNYANFKGRARRKAFWMFFLFNFIASMIIGAIDAILGLGFLGVIYMLAVLVPYIAYAVRRLHDTGRSGWWMLIGLIPLIGGIVLLVFFVLDSTEDNDFGPNPKASEA